MKARKAMQAGPLDTVVTIEVFPPNGKRFSVDMLIPREMRLTSAVASKLFEPSLARLDDALHGDADSFAV